MGMKVLMARMLEDREAYVQVSAPFQRLAQMGDRTLANPLMSAGISGMRHDRDETVWRIAASREVVDGVADVFNICPLQRPGLWPPASLALG